jgi:hypothetical protein
MFNKDDHPENNVRSDDFHWLYLREEEADVQPPHHLMT